MIGLKTVFLMQKVEINSQKFVEIVHSNAKEVIELAGLSFTLQDMTES